MPRLPRQLEALSRMLTYMLCHRPDEFGLVLSEDGFVPVKHLHQALMAEPGWSFVRRHHLEEVAALIQPPRFEVAEERIRGLSPPPARLRRPPGEEPPALLYLAISPKAHERVWEQGLMPTGDQELLLAVTPEMARKLGQRRTPVPVLITILAQAAAKAGVPFQGYGQCLFLAPALPREFLQLPPSLQGREKAQPVGAPRPLPTPGSFTLDIGQMLKEGHKPRGKKGEPAWKAGTRVLRRKGRR